MIYEPNELFWKKKLEMQVPFCNLSLKFLKFIFLFIQSISTTVEWNKCMNVV